MATASKPTSKAAEGDPITLKAPGQISVPDHPIIPFIEGDGTGPDIWRASRNAFEAAVEKAYGAKRKIAWFEVYAGQKSYDLFGNWLPDETVEAFTNYLVGIKGPLTTPVGGGIRSLNVALRQMMDLYVCLRPVRYFQGVPSQVKHPERVDMVIFRENTEDIYAGVEWAAGTPEARKVIDFVQKEMGVKKIRFPENCGVGFKPISKEGTQRLVAAALDYAIANHRRNVTLVHKGNIMKFTEGAFRDWGYELVREKYQGKATPWEDCAGRAPSGHICVKDAIADNFLQQILLRAEEYDVVATMNLNGDYISDALAAQVGGIGIAPGGNINYITGHAIFEATHGTAPKYAGQDVVNPGSVMLSGEMMLRHMGWTEAADLMIKGIEGAIKAKTVTYDFHRLLEADGIPAKKVKTSEFAQEVIKHMED